MRRLSCVAVVCLALLLSFGTVAQASIQPPPTASSHPNYVGWGYIHDARCNYTWRCPVTTPPPAWRWTGSSWQQAYRTSGERVWVHPYAANWTWTWTYASGWLAMRSGYVAISSRY